MGNLSWRDQVARVYRRMAKDARYRPGAPSDGFGNITGELNMEQEVRAYAALWRSDEDSMSFWLGCPDFKLRPAMVLAVEAARACCGADQQLAVRLLRLAVDEAVHAGHERESS